MSFIEIKDLFYRYDPKKTDGISDLNFSVKKSEIF